MSKPHPGPDQILETLERLRTLATDQATRHAKILDAAAERERVAQRRADSIRKSSQEQLAVALEQTRKPFAESLEAAHTHARRRIARIRQAQVTVRKAAAKRADSEEGREKFEIQREMLRATRHRDAGLADAKAAFDAFNASLESLQKELDAQEREAQRLLSIYGKALAHPPTHAHEKSQVDATPPEQTLATHLAAQLESSRADLAAFRSRLLPTLSRAWPVALILVLSPAAIIPVLLHFGVQSPSWQNLVQAAVALGVLSLAIHFIGRHLCLPAARRIVSSLSQARVLLHLCRTKASETHQTSRARLEAEFEEVSTRSHEAWSLLASRLESSRGSLPAQVDARAQRAIARVETHLQTRIARLHKRHHADLEAIEAHARECLASALVDVERTLEMAGTERTDALQTLAADWSREALPILESLDAFRHLASGTSPSALPSPPEAWSPPLELSPILRFGAIEANLDHLLKSLPPPTIPASVPSGHWSLPLLLRFPSAGSVLIEADASRRSLALGSLNHIVCRILAQSPPGRVAFTVYDPVGLGQSFSGLTHLADEAEHLIDGRIWTQSTQLEERLADLNDHLEKVIQMYLRNDFPTIAEYNEQAGNIAEKYRFLVVADFPSGFTDLALRRLLAIATAGARCGVFLLIHWDTQGSLPADFPVATLRHSALRLTFPSLPTDPAPLLNERAVSGVRVVLDPAPKTEAVTAFIHQVARANLDSNRVEVPFAHIAPDESEFWSGDTAAELRVPIGRTGATKLQYLALGKATRQHALIAGKTGSGKSTLFHVLITNLSLWCRPDQVEFYLVDFKKGVEFKCYATHRLPHARVVAIESDRDFGLSVLQRLDEELRRRGDLFRSAQVQDIAAYRRSAGALPMPRVLLLVDEFQEFFVEEDRVAQNASVLLDRIVRQGRAFGIHVILGSQTLGGAYTVARSTLGQMAVRIALQCNEADALLIMDEDNPAPRLLSRPGEAIYNDAAGARAGNSPFQVVWLPDEIRDARLRQIRQKADELSPPAPGPLVFEGDAPADPQDNPLLQNTLATSPDRSPSTGRIWLGAPNSIKDPTEVAFARRTADNLLMVGQRDDAILSLSGIALAALAAQYPAGTVEFIVLDGSAPGSTDQVFLARIAKSLPHPITLVRPADAGPVIQELSTELRARTATPSNGETPARYLLVHALQNFRMLRQEDEFSFGSADAAPHPGTLFKELLAEGPAQGIHSLVSCDSYGNVVRFLGRKGLAEFGYRVLFQMSANDSASLIDQPAASRLGLHRALLYQDREGHTEIFRPYALPHPDSLRPRR